MHSHITRVTAMDSCFVLIGAHQHGIAVGLMNGENPRVSKTLYCRGECKAFLKVPAPHNTCGSCWLGTTRHFSHDMRGEGGLGVTLICVPVFASGKWKTEENLIFDDNFTCIQCSIEKLSFFVLHFCGNIRIFVATTCFVFPL